MAKLNRLINGQNIRFDTHQAGDGQEVHWTDVHLEKRLHNHGGKIRFPLIGNGKPSKSYRVSDEEYNRVIREVRDVLDSNREILEKLARTIVDILSKFSNGKANTEDARQAAKKIAGYFNLDDQFETIMERYAKSRLIFFISVHMNYETGFLQEIIQSRDRVSVRKARKYIRLL